MFKFTVTGKRNKYELKIEGGKITTQKLERSAIDKVEPKKEITAPAVDETTKEERVTAKYLGKRKVEVTVKAGNITASRLYKETLRLHKSAERIRKITVDFWNEDGIYVREKEVYQAICKSTRGLAGMHIQATYEKWYHAKRIGKFQFFLFLYCLEI